MSDDCKVIFDLLGKQFLPVNIHAFVSKLVLTFLIEYCLTLASLLNYFVQYKESGYDKTHAMNFKNMLNIYQVYTYYWVLY